MKDLVWELAALGKPRSRIAARDGKFQFSPQASCCVKQSLTKARELGLGKNLGEIWAQARGSGQLGLWPVRARASLGSGQFGLGPSRDRANSGSG